MPDTAPRDVTAEASIERPVPGKPGNTIFGSDVVAEVLRGLDIPYIALNPGASYRGLHDSLVNHLGNEKPQMLVCLHEEHAVSLAQGYAKVTGKPMLVAVHSNVGLFHATMSIYNAWCDRVPMIVIGATGPVDAAKRRPWIDWIHTARDQAAVIRNFIKWDDQPASAEAARESLARAAWLTQTYPKGPVYINLDAAMQEAALPEPLPPFDLTRFMPEVKAEIAADTLDQAIRMLSNAERPIILMGRVQRDSDAWDRRVALAEALGARVITDLKVGATFPTLHPLHVSPSTPTLNAATSRAIAEADVILSLDFVDLAGTLRSANKGKVSAAKILQASQDYQLHNGWSLDHQALPPVDLFLPAPPDTVVASLLTRLPPASHTARPSPATPFAAPLANAGAICLDDLTGSLRRAIGDRPSSLLHIPTGWNTTLWPLGGPLDYIGHYAGGGLGSGPGVSVGAALALRGSGRFPVTVCGDGDFLMGAMALWTAAHYRIPLLFVIANNCSYFNDEMHQERVAEHRGRPAENRWIGQRIADPDVDLALVARGQGAVAFGPVSSTSELDAVFDQAVAIVDGGGLAFVDVRVEKR